MISDHDRARGEEQHSTELTFPARLGAGRLLAELSGSTDAARSRRRNAAGLTVALVLAGYLAFLAGSRGFLDAALGTGLAVTGAALLVVGLVWWQTRKVVGLELELEDRLAERIEAEAFARELFEKAPDATVLVDAEGRILQANAQAEELLGWTPEELVGEPVEVLVPDALRRAHVEARTGYVRSPERRAMGRGRELVALHREGREVPTEISLGPMRLGGELRVMVALRDVTGRRAARREERRRLEEIERLNRELEAFVSAVTHDLRAPLRAIDGFSRRLVEGDHDLDDEGRRLLDVVRERAGYMRGLVDDLLRLSRVSQESLERQVIDMSRLAASALAQVGRDTYSEEAEVEIRFLPDAEGDEELLRQVWVNYLDNALKYSAHSDDRRVVVEGAEEGGEVVYRVRDHGVGFPPELGDRLFRVFERLHPEEMFTGSGVGLATVRRIVHRHGGRVRAESAPDGGAVFSFSLPRPDPGLAETP